MPYGLPGGRGPNLATEFVVASTIPAGPIPLIPTELPGPIPATQRGTIDVAVSLLLTTLAVVTAVQGVVIREPLYTVRPAAKSAPEWQIPPNLLTTTLVQVVAGTPLLPTDIALVRRVVNVQQFDPPNLLVRLPVTAPGIPFLPVDWQIPARSRAQQQFDPPNATIALPQTTPDVVVLRGPLYSYPGRAKSAPDWIAPNVLTAGMAPAGPSGTSFPSPYITPLQGAKRQIQSFEPPNLTITLPVTAVAPFRPIDIPILRATINIQKFDTPQNFVLTIPPLPSGTSFIPVDWPVPYRSRAQQFFDPPNVTINLPVIVVPPEEPHVGAGGGFGDRKNKKYQLKPKFLRETFEIRKEKEFLAVFQDRIDELAGIVRAPAVTTPAIERQQTAEIKLLSNINALAKSYSTELDSIDAARILIAQRLADIANEEALAVILIAAHL